MIDDQPSTRGALIGYARVSTEEQNLDRQIHALTDAGCTRIYRDKLSGRDTERPELHKALDYLRPGDQLVVTDFSRLSRSVRDLTTLVSGLHERGIEFRSLSEQIDTSSATGELVFHVIGSINQFVRRLIVDGTNEGLAAARREGKTLGRPPVMDAEAVRRARIMLARTDASVSSTAAAFGVSRSTLYKYIPELSDGGQSVVRETVQAEALAAYDAAQVPGQTSVPVEGESTR